MNGSCVVHGVVSQDVSLTMKMSSGLVSMNVLGAISLSQQVCNHFIRDCRTTPGTCSMTNQDASPSLAVTRFNDLSSDLIRVDLTPFSTERLSCLRLLLFCRRKTVRGGVGWPA